MPRCICHDEASLVCCKISVCNIDGDTLLTLRHQSIQKKRIVNGTAAASYLGIKL